MPVRRTAGTDGWHLLIAAAVASAAVPSNALAAWRADARAAFDQLDAAGAALIAGAATPDAPSTAPTALHHALVVLLVAHFQAFCRDLHSEAADAIAASGPARFADIVAVGLTAGRQLDRRVPHPRTLAEDFARLGLDLWPEVAAVEPRCDAHRLALGQLCAWRNAVAHHHFPTERPLVPAAVDGAICHAWRQALDTLALALDRAVMSHTSQVAGQEPR